MRGICTRTPLPHARNHRTCVTSAVFISHLRLTNFRNFVDERITLPPGGVAIVGAGVFNASDDDILLVARSDIELEAIPDDRKEADSDMLPAAARGAGMGAGAGLLAVATVAFAYAFFGWNALQLISSRIYGFVSVYVLLAVPMFLLMAAIMARSGVARDLYDAMSIWAGGMPGGIAVMTLIAAVMVFFSLCIGLNAEFFLKVAQKAADGLMDQSIYRESVLRTLGKGGYP